MSSAAPILHLHLKARLELLRDKPCASLIFLNTRYPLLPQTQCLAWCLAAHGSFSSLLPGPSFPSPK